MICNFYDANAQDASIVGRKAKVLAELYKAGFPIPDGFILSFQFFRGWIHKIVEQDIWNSNLENPTDENYLLLKREASKLHLNDSQKVYLDQFLERFHDSEVFMIHSSYKEIGLESTDFNSDISLYGVQYGNLENAILEMFISSFELLNTKRELLSHLKDSFPGISVIIQRQVIGESSGYGFIVNSQKNATDDVMLKSVFGMIEGIWSKQVDSDTFVVRGNKVFKEKIVKKRIKLYVKQRGKIEKRIVSEPFKESISHAQAVEIANMVRSVNTFYNRPLNVKWTIANNKIFLLQVNPQ